MIKVQDVQPKPGHLLDLTFSDGSSGQVNVDDLLNEKLFAPLTDEALFARVYIDHGAVCWPGDIDIAPEFLYARVHALQQPDTFEQAQQNELTMSLREVRKLAGKTQLDVSAVTGMEQSELSRLEHREDYRLSTLRQYIQAVGGKLEVSVVIGDKRIALRGI
jgi:hypothetical protein